LSSEALGDVLEEHRGGNEKAPQLQWTLSFHTHALVAVRADGMRLTFTRKELAANADLLIGTFIRSLAVREPQRAPIPLTPPALAAVRRFIDPIYDEHLAATLKRRMRMLLPLGVFVLVMAAPPLMPELDLRGAVIGGGMIVISVLSRVWKHRALFLADALLWLMIAANNTLLYLSNAKFVFIAFAAIGVFLAIGLAKLYVFYNPAK
jgi:hypothetical protein